MLNKNTLRKLLADPVFENSETEVLNLYLNSINHTGRVNIPKKTDNQIEMEEVVSQLIQSFIIAPCLIQIDYSQESYSLSSVKTFVSILIEQEGLWKGILKNQTWVSVGFNLDKVTLCFAKTSISSEQLENTVKTIHARTSDIVAYRVTQNESQHEINFKVDGLAHAKLTSEGSIL